MVTRFHEVQRFPAPMRALTFVPTLVLAWGLVEQARHGSPWGDGSVTSVVLLVTFVVAGVVLPVVFATSRLETTVDDQGLAVRFLPFKPTPERYGWDELVSTEAVTYRPLRDYGGWGIRLGPKGWAYNVSGDRGVLLTFPDDSTLLIGSRRADELAAALARRG